MSTPIVTSITFNLAGTYTTSDLAANSFEIFYSTTGLFDDQTDNIIGNFYPVVASGNSFTAQLAQPITVGAPGYFFLVADAAASPTLGHNIMVNAVTSANVTLADAGTVTGTAAAGGLQTFANAPYGGTITPANSIICPAGSVSLNAVGAIGIYNWQSSTDNINWTPIPGATHISYTASPSVNTYYRVVSSFLNTLFHAKQKSSTGIQRRA